MARRPDYIRLVSNDDPTAKRLGNGGGGPYDPGMDARVAALEQIAKDTKEALVRIETDLKAGFNKLRDDQRSDFKWLLGMILGLGALGLTLGGTLLTVMAKGFKWF